MKRPARFGPCRWPNLSVPQSRAGVLMAARRRRVGPRLAGAGGPDRLRFLLQRIANVADPHKARPGGEDGRSHIVAGIQDRLATFAQALVVEPEHALEAFAALRPDPGGQSPSLDRFVVRPEQGLRIALSPTNFECPSVILDDGSDAEQLTIKPEGEACDVREAEEQVPDRLERGRFTGFIRSEDQVQIAGGLRKGESAVFEAPVTEKL